MKIPKSFVLGTATAAYQIEGASRADGKGASIWDTFAHRRGKILDSSTGDVAVDHYHRYEEDVALMKELGADAYRLSVSWPRLFPEGTGRMNSRGLDFYERLVDELLRNDIEPFITLFHWDFPEALQRRGGLTVRESADWFADYARAVVDALGDRVSKWMTINEPWVHTLNGYLVGSHAPGIRNPWAFMKACHHILLAHTKGYHAIKSSRPDAEVGIALSMIPVHPASDSAADRRAASLADQFVRGLFLDPLFKGFYPSDLSKRLRLFRPRIRPGDLEAVKGTFDWIGVNHYTRVFARSRWYMPFVRFWLQDHPLDEAPGATDDSRYTSMGWEIYPRGMYEVLTTFRDEYGNPPIYITENGAAFEDTLANGRIHDRERVDYLHSYLEMALRAQQEGSDVRGLFVWSLLDNFEWAFGYEKRFGIVYVDFETEERIVKDSGRWFAELTRSRRLPVSADERSS